MSKTIRVRKAIIGRRTTITVLAETVVPPGVTPRAEVPVAAPRHVAPAAVTHPAEVHRAEARHVRQHLQGPQEDRTR